MSKDRKTLIIAEAGVNHNGDLALAKKLVEVAAQAGADLVKFQTFKASRLVTAAAQKAPYQEACTGAEESQYAMLRRLELSDEAYHVLLKHCRAHGIGFLSTGFDVESVDFLESLGVRLFKVPSGEITNLPYLRHVGAKRGEVILSTGMATLGEVEAAIDVLEQAGTPRSDIIVLHCTTEYPASLEAVNLKAMQSMQTAFQLRVGYSDHTEGIAIALAAVALGACVIEKHFTMDRDLPGPDHRASLEPRELAALVQSIRTVEVALGDGVKRMTAAEEHNKPVARKSIVAASAIAKGELFSEKNLAVKRPGTGISPMCWDEVVGHRAPRDFQPDEPVSVW
jgi:N,N'-diacetyllegionaminate synthase